MKSVNRLAFYNDVMSLVGNGKSISNAIKLLIQRGKYPDKFEALRSLYHRMKRNPMLIKQLKEELKEKESVKSKPAPKVVNDDAFKFEEVKYCIPKKKGLSLWRRILKFFGLN